jgi:hypothetical protein
LSVAAVDHWAGEDVTVDDVERAIGMLRAGGDSEVELRTSVMTHIAWVPPRWVDEAWETFMGLGERYPSRTILLLAARDEPDGLDARVSLQCFPAGADQVCAELVELTLRGARAEAPASIVAPLLLPDLPVFLRWRGQPPFGEKTFERLAGLVDRFIVNSREWDDLPAAYGPLADHFGPELAVSDIVWTRGLPWRAACAFQWPAIGDVETLRIKGPLADALLLVGWLRSRLKRSIAVEHEPADNVESIEGDGVTVPPPQEPSPKPGELLSQELDRFGRDRIYEEAVRACASPT